MKKILLFLILLQIVIGAVYLESANARSADNSRFIFTELTAKDTITGLVWTIDADPAGKGLSWSDVYFFLKKLNEAKYAQCDHWRAPEREELESLLGVGAQMGVTKGFDAFLNKAGFRNVKGQYYWTSTASWVGWDDEPARKVVNLYSGGVKDDTIVVSVGSYNNYLWPVCSDQR